MKLTTEQYDLVNEEVVDQISEMLGVSLGDSDAIATEIIGEVINDIEETADWGGLDDNEICVGDVTLAIQRSIVKRIL